MCIPAGKNGSYLESCFAKSFISLFRSNFLLINQVIIIIIIIIIM